MRQDHMLHALAGLGIAFVAGVSVTPAFGLAVGVGAGLGKEAFDRVSGVGTPELSDIIATWLGAGAGSAAAWGLV